MWGTWSRTLFTDGAKWRRSVTTYEKLVVKLFNFQIDHIKFQPTWPFRKYFPVVTWWLNITGRSATVDAVGWRAEDMWITWYRDSLAPDNHQALRIKEARLPKITGSSPQLHKRRYNCVHVFMKILLLSKILPTSGFYIVLYKRLNSTWLSVINQNPDDTDAALRQHWHGTVYKLFIEWYNLIENDMINT